MAYTHNWTHQDANGHVLAGDRIYAVDSTEIRDAAGRRLKLMFDQHGKWPIPSTAAVGTPIDDQNMQTVRDGFAAAVPSLLSFFQGDSSWWQGYTVQGWLYSVAGADENKYIVNKPAGAGEVNFFAKLNGGGGWTGSVGVGQPVRAVHINEPRDAAAMLSRGRFILRVLDGGEARATKDLPGGLWYPPAVARDGSDEMHSWFGGQVWMWKPDGAGGWFGLRDQCVTVRSTSKIRLMPQGTNVKLRLYHCAGHLEEGEFTWAEGQAATGQHSADFDLTDNTWTEWSSPAFVALLQQMADGQAEPSFKVAPNEETGWGDEPTHVQVEVVVDFDLNSPPV